jgi:hypothetical protein
LYYYRLKNGSLTTDPRLDRIYQQDLRSLNHLIRGRIDPEAIEKPRSYTWSCPYWLDQGYEGACVGFGFCHDLLARPQGVLGIDNQYARELYWQAQMDDPWPGGAYPSAEPFYEGTSVLTGAQVCKKRGFYSSYSWALNARQVAEGIGYTGPAILGLDWFEGMFEPDEDGFLRPTGDLAGGHCLVAIGVRLVFKRWSGFYFWRTRSWDDVDFDRSYVTVHNSWGQAWGNNGRAKISLTDLDFLMDRYGEACFPQRTSKIMI